jgi:tripeptide aminopeptidase
LAQGLAHDVKERFLRYVRIDTQSRYGTDEVPSTAKQLDLSRLLVDELTELGAEDVEMDEHGLVFATIPATVDGDVPVFGVLAHVDTSPDESGAGVEPQLVVFDGSPIRLPRSPDQVIDPADTKDLENHVGHEIVTTDGTTLLGADDKAGVAEIMAAVAYLKRHPAPPHAPIRVCFTVDEEIGAGADHLDIDDFGARYAYTLDGSGLGEIETETFNATKVIVTVHGRAVHPGSAKGKLVNAIRLAADFVAALPRDRLTPETTEDREGFIHPGIVTGNGEKTVVELIVRDHDRARLEEHIALLRATAEEVATTEPRARIEVHAEETYRNMREVIDQHPQVVEKAEEAVRRAGAEPVQAIIRGGTDGARLSARGLPTPNLFTGGQEYHSLREWASVQDMAAAAATVVELARVWAED